MSVLNQEKRFLFNTLKPYKVVIGLFLSGSLLATLLDGISIGLLVPLLDYIQGSPDGAGLPGSLRWLASGLNRYDLQTKLMLSVGCVALAVLLKNLMLGLTLRKGEWLSNQIRSDLRLQAAGTMLRSGLEFHNNAKRGELIEQITNHPQQLRNMAIHFVDLVIQSLTILILLTLLFLLSWQLSVLAMIIGSLCAVIMKGYLKHLYPLGELEDQAGRRLTHALQENLNAIALIKSFHQERKNLANMRQKIDAHNTASNRLARRLVLVQPLTEGLAVISICALLAVAPLYLSPNDGTILSRLIPFFYIIVRITGSLRFLTGSMSVIQRNLPYLKSLSELVRLDNKSVIQDGHCRYEGLKREIVFDSVSFSYEQSGKKPALKNVSFSIPKGMTSAIVGKSGTGKSTIAKLLLRLFEPQEGSIRLDGVSLADLQLASYLPNVGIVSQDTFIFNETVKENIVFGADGPVAEERIVDVARKAGAHEFILGLRHGYDTPLGDQGVKLSGGQRQRISIARAILKDPEILILDEATNELDAITERAIQQALDELCRDRTVIVIAHRFSTIQNADQIIVMKDGAVAEIGPSLALLEKKQEYYALAVGQQK